MKTTDYQDTLKVENLPLENKLKKMMQILIKFRILDCLIFIALAFALWYFANFYMIEYAIGFFVGYLVFVIGPIVYKIKV